MKQTSLKKNTPFTIRILSLPVAGLFLYVLDLGSVFGSDTLAMHSSVICLLVYQLFTTHPPPPILTLLEGEPVTAGSLGMPSTRCCPQLCGKHTWASSAHGHQWLILGQGHNSSGARLL